MEEQTATLRRALDALNSICRKPQAAIEEQAQPEASSPVLLPPGPVDPAEWRKPFVQWLDSDCARHPRAFGGVAALHLAYCEWEIAHDGVPCTRETFEQLLEERGFLMGEVEGTALVSGLALREDVEAAGLNTQIRK
jgi:hypothetical protein